MTTKSSEHGIVVDYRTFNSKYNRRFNARGWRTVVKILQSRVCDHMQLLTNIGTHSLPSHQTKVWIAVKICLILKVMIFRRATKFHRGWLVLRRKAVVSCHYEYQNIRGLRTKFQDFCDLTVRSDYDIMWLSETWLVENIGNAKCFFIF